MLKQYLSPLRSLLVSELALPPLAVDIGYTVLLCCAVAIALKLVTDFAHRGKQHTEIRVEATKFDYWYEKKLEADKTARLKEEMVRSARMRPWHSVAGPLIFVSCPSFIIINIFILAHAVAQTAKTVPSDTGNEFAGRIRRTALAAKRRAAKEAAKPRAAWLGKQRFLSSQIDDALLGSTHFQPPARPRCWFGSDCSRCSDTTKPHKVLKLLHKVCSARCWLLELCDSTD